MTSWCIYLRYLIKQEVQNYETNFAAAIFAAFITSVLRSADIFHITTPTKQFQGSLSTNFL